MAINLEALLPSNCVYAQSTAGSAKAVLEQFAQLLGDQCTCVTSKTILDAFIQRERLGSTVLRSGIALPHARCPGIIEPICAVICLSTGIDFGAHDKTKTDLFFALLVPEGDAQIHLDILKAITQKLSHDDYCMRLRQAQTNDDLYQAILS